LTSKNLRGKPETIVPNRQETAERKGTLQTGAEDYVHKQASLDRNQCGKYLSCGSMRTKPPPSPRDKEEENKVGANVRGAQDDIAAESEEERESAGRRQGALKGPPAIEQRNIAGPCMVAQGRAPATVAQG
jgi:hypothetical protein